MYGNGFTSPQAANALHLKTENLSEKETKMAMNQMEVFKIQLIKEDELDVDLDNMNIPKWQKKVNEVNLKFTRLISNMFAVFPIAASHFEGAYLNIGDPNNYAMFEVLNKFNIPYRELYYSYYYINTQTLGFGDLEGSGIVDCAETEYENKYGDTMNNKLFQEPIVREGIEELGIVFAYAVTGFNETVIEKEKYDEKWAELNNARKKIKEIIFKE